LSSYSASIIAQSKTIGAMLKNLGLLDNNSESNRDDERIEFTVQVTAKVMRKVIRWMQRRRGK
jgi:hypothetical protein